MLGASLIYPMFAMVVLSIVVVLILLLARIRAVREGKVPGHQYKTMSGAVEPDYALKPARHFANLFETPVLFYAACLAAMITQQTGSTMQLLAWAYVVVRVLHALVHLGPNKIYVRAGIYFVGILIIFTMWLLLVLGVGMRA
jgi:hypothetical protein